MSTIRKQFHLYIYTMTSTSPSVPFYFDPQRYIKARYNDVIEIKLIYKAQNSFGSGDIVSSNEMGYFGLLHLLPINYILWSIDFPFIILKRSIRFKPVNLSCFKANTLSISDSLSVSSILQTPRNKFKTDWKDLQKIEISFDSLKYRSPFTADSHSRQVEAFREILILMHSAEPNLASLSLYQGSHRIKHGTNMETELCIAASMLCLKNLQAIFEQQLINSLCIKNVLQAIYYASTYRSKHILLYCFKWILMHLVSSSLSIH